MRGLFLGDAAGKHVERSLAGAVRRPPGHRMPGRPRRNVHDDARARELVRRRQKGGTQLHRGHEIDLQCRHECIDRKGLDRFDRFDDAGIVDQQEAAGRTLPAQHRREPVRQPGRLRPVGEVTAAVRKAETACLHARDLCFVFRAGDADHQTLRRSQRLDKGRTQSA